MRIAELKSEIINPKSAILLICYKPHTPKADEIHFRPARLLQSSVEEYLTDATQSRITNPIQAHCYPALSQSACESDLPSMPTVPRCQSAMRAYLRYHSPAEAESARPTQERMKCTDRPGSGEHWRSKPLASTRQSYCWQSASIGVSSPHHFG